MLENVFLFLIVAIVSKENSLEERSCCVRDEIVYKQLRKATQSLLKTDDPHETNDPHETDDPHGMYEMTLKNIGELFWKASGFYDKNENEIFETVHRMKKQTSLEMGLAVSPALAIKCIEDYNRTSKYIRGVHDAINAEKKRSNSDRVIVLYAGCGPFASLVFPLMSIFSPEELGIILLDIHNVSVESVKSMIKNLCLEEYIVDIQVVDATKYVIPEGIRVNVVVMETMSSGLQSEPQVQISRWLISQAPDAILIPESIRVNLMIKKNVDGDRQFVQTVFEVNKTTIQLWSNIEGNILPGQSLTRKVFFDGNIELDTEITVFRNHVLKENESTITVTIDLECFQERKKRNVDGFVIKSIEYELGDTPGLRCVLQSQ